MNEKLREDSWLTGMVGRPVACFLGNGVRLEGVLRGFDLDVLFLSPDASGREQPVSMLYKGFLASVVPITSIRQQHAYRLPTVFSNRARGDR